MILLATFTYKQIRANNKELLPGQYLYAVHTNISGLVRTCLLLMRENS